MRSLHPGWCDPRYCRFTDIDVQHRSTPTLLSTRDHEWWFTLARANEWAYLEHQGDTELLIDVHNTLMRVPHVQHVLRTDEIESYANRLLIECRRAQLLGMPVLQDVVAVSLHDDSREKPRRDGIPAPQHAAGRPDSVSADEDCSGGEDFDRRRRVPRMSPSEQCAPKVGHAG